MKRDVVADLRAIGYPMHMAKDQPDPRAPDHSREGIFVYHNCWKCRSGELPCAKGNPRNCEYPRARDD